MQLPAMRFNLIEGFLFALLIVMIGYFVGRAQTERQLQPFLSRGSAELQPLKARFGPGRNSRYGEEWIIRDYFNDQRDGVFLDVGANDFKRDSNTYFLEIQLGWTGIAIEPQTKFAPGYAKHRPKTRFVPLFVSEASNQKAILYVSKNDLVASSDERFVQEEGGGSAQPVRVNTTTLDDILSRSGITRLDFVSIDVELHEPEVLSGFSINRFEPKLVCIEAHLPVRQKVLDYFAAHGYTIVGKYLRADAENLWFGRMPSLAK
jgi:FkbM family methyltransferase